MSTTGPKARPGKAGAALNWQQALASGKIEEAHLSWLRHELRTPLNAIIGYSEMLVEDAEDGGRVEAVEDLQRIQISARRLLEMIEDYFAPRQAGARRVDAAEAAGAEAARALPRPVAPLTPPVMAIAAEAPEQGSLLVVDDNAMNRDLLSRFLQRRGHTVALAKDGPQALEMVKGQTFDLILLDIMMPGMDGFEVCQRLKADGQTRDIPVLFISALGELQDKVQAFALGGVDYITKPFQSAEVQARVETHLALRKLQKRLQEANQKMAQELALAGEVQTSFLPREVPDIPGWQLSVALRPARETSGDFYDLIPLPGGLLGIVVADVVDKGVGSALYMALSCTLLRTFAPLYPDQPEMAVAAANQRILDDTKSNRFATVLYGVLDPATGALVYCNAGHSVPYLFRSSGSVEALELTGVPMGLFSGETWGRAGVQLAPGDVLVLYTDGIPEARDETGAFFEEAGLMACVEECLDRAAAQGPSAGEVQEAVMAAVCAFMGDAPQADDITLAVVVREPAGRP